MKKIISVLKWTAIVIVAAFLLLVIIRIPHAVDTQMTAEQVAKIHATKLTIDDVMGKNLPPDPGADADKTVAGIDANKNGIRDDVELAIFKAYPNSAKTRAVLLEYALTLQMELTQPFLETENVVAVVQEGDRAIACVGDTLVPRDTPESGRTNLQMRKIDIYINFVNNLQFNNKKRKGSENDFIEKLGSYASLPSICDISSSTLPN